MKQSELSISPRTRLRIAMAFAIAADVLEILVLPLVVEGFDSPAADLLDIGICIVLTHMLGWHWEFAPSFLGKLMPGADLAPLWTLAVMNVYRKSKHSVITIEGTR